MQNKIHEPRTRWVEKFGKHGKFDAYDGISPHGKMLEPFVEKSAFDALEQYSATQAAELAEYKILHSNGPIGEVGKLTARVRELEAERDELLACEKIHVSDIADLEKQLAESTRQVAEYKGHYTSEQQLSARLGEKVDTLQFRLAECEEKNKQWEITYDANLEERDELRKELAAREKEIEELKCRLK